jgi:hypothetical protein
MVLKENSPHKVGYKINFYILNNLLLPIKKLLMFKFLLIMF